MTFDSHKALRGEKMQKSIHRYLSVVDKVNEWTGKSFGYVVLALTFMLLFEVISRYFFNRPTMWVSEVSQFLSGVYMLIVGGYVLLHNSHVRIDILWSRFSRRNQAIIDLFTSGFFFLFIISLLIEAGRRTWLSILALEVSPSVWRPPIWPVKILVVVAALLLFLQGTAKFIRDLYTVRGVDIG